MNDEKTVCTALLHDVIEDTDVTLEQLKEQGFGDEIIEALKLLTYDKSLPYLDYVRNISLNPIARRVKKADLNHNIDLTRLDNADREAVDRIKKYQYASEILNGKTENI